jgi:DNA polymerase/3'-5' exonuclease PolX
MQLSEWGLINKETGRKYPISDEKQVFEKIGIDYIPLNERR